MKMIPTTIMLRPDQMKALAALRVKTGISMGEAIRRAIDKWIQQTQHTKR